MKNPLLSSLIICIFLIASASQQRIQNKNSPGINVFLRPAFFSDLTSQFTSYLIDKLEKTNFPNITRKLQNNYLSAQMSIDNIKFSGIHVNQASSGVIFPEENSMRFQLDDISSALDFDYSFATKPAFLVDGGHSHLSIDRFNLTVDVGLDKKSYKESHRLKANVTTFKITLNQDVFNFEFSGKEAVSNFFNYIVADIEYLLGLQLVQNAGQILQNITESKVNAYLKTIPFQTQLTSPPMHVDYSVLSPPSVSKVGLGVGFNATFFIPNKPADLVGPIQLMPKNNPNGKNLQIFISEYTFNTIFHSLFEMNRIQTKITKQSVNNTKFIKMDTKWIGQIIPEFKKTYKTNRETRFIIKAIEAPKLLINQGDMDLVIHTVMDIQAMKQDKSSFESALLIYFDFHVDVDFAVEKQNLMIKLNTFDLDVTKKESITLPEVKGKQLDNLMSVAKSSLKPILNSILAPGYPLPLPKGIDVEDFTISEWEGYLEIQAVPIFVPSEFDEPEKEDSKKEDSEKEDNQQGDEKQILE